jgi:hypothetical protein
MALRWTGDRFEASYAQPPGYDRPWARERDVIANPARPQDVTPKPDDLEAGD